ncbi:hypothetical protein LDENG_00109090 [Lucifuga dentata]|nr:hypothetical protein LDENG_00109090 [Lucifuga dentata]
MASGVEVTDEVIAIFNDMKVRKCQSTEEEKKKRKKAIIFRICDNNRSIIPEQDKQILIGDLGVTVSDCFQHFVDMLPPDECRYALFDATFETKESKKEDLVFIFWAPECAKTKCKMIYASSKDAIKRKMPGIKHEWQVNSLEELDRKALGQKLGGDAVTSLEGCSL